jgi:hypothetical protein
MFIEIASYFFEKWQSDLKFLRTKLFPQLGEQRTNGVNAFLFPPGSDLPAFLNHRRDQFQFLSSRVTQGAAAYWSEQQGTEYSLNFSILNNVP